jgi:hypothetical protein
MESRGSATTVRFVLGSVWHDVIKLEWIVHNIIYPVIAIALSWILSPLVPEYICADNLRSDSSRSAIYEYVPLLVETIYILECLTVTSQNTVYIGSKCGQHIQRW